MRYLLAHSHHGPFVYAQAAHRWVVMTPGRAPEVYPGQLPPACLQHAREVPVTEAKDALATAQDEPAAALLPLAVGTGTP